MVSHHAEDFEDIRAGVRAVCAEFPDEYHRQIDRDRGYPEEFVEALTRAGWMAALIPETYGGSGLSLTEASVIMEEINRAGGNSGACHGQMYNMNTLIRHGSEDQRPHLSAQDRQRRPALAIDGRHRTHHRHRHQPTSRPPRNGTATVMIVNGQKVWISRVKHFESDDPAGAYNPACRGERNPTACPSSLSISMKRSHPA